MNALGQFFDVAVGLAVLVKVIQFPLVAEEAAAVARTQLLHHVRAEDGPVHVRDDHSLDCLRLLGLAASFCSFFFSYQAVTAANTSLPGDTAKPLLTGSGWSSECWIKTWNVIDRNRITRKRFPFVGLVTTTRFRFIAFF